MIIYKNHWCEPNSAETCLQSIYELAIDYDGYRDADNLMDLIDEMKDIAVKGLTFLHQGQIYQKIIHVDKDLEI